MFFDDIFFDNKDDNVSLYGTKEGFLYGNMFKNEYKGYKNYRPLIITASDEKGKLLLAIYELDFAMNDLSLYLDLHPDDMNTYKLFKQYTQELNKLVDKYEEQYGPMELCSSNYDKYEWVDSKLPFKGGNI